MTGHRWFCLWIAAALLLAGGCKEKHRSLRTDLHRAAEAGDLARVQTLIARGANVNARDDIGRTPLHWAALRRHKDVAEVLVRCGANVDSLDEAGRTPAMIAMQSRSGSVAQYLVQAGAMVNLHLAVFLGDTARVASLIKSGVDVNAVEDGMYGISGWTPLHYATCYNRKEIADRLIAAGAKIDPKDEIGCTPLHLATEEHFTDMVKLLLARGADVNAKGEVGNTALHVADVNTAKVLLAAGADVEARNQSGETPLYLAAESGWTEMVEVLIAGGADVNRRMVRDTFSESPLEAAIKNGHIEMARLLAPRVKDINAHLPLQAAITGGYWGASARWGREHPDPNATFEDREAEQEREIDRLRILMVELLLACGADVNAKSEEGWTALHCAASEGLKDIAELLLRKGANVRARAARRYWLRNDPVSARRLFAGITPLHEAAASGGPELVELLIAHGAEVNAKTESGKTPLHYAASYGYTQGLETSPRRYPHYRDRWQQSDVIELLLAAGAEVNAKDADGATPLRYALQSGQRAIAKLLIAAGAETVAVKNETDQRMLHDAFGDIEWVRLLLANGADTEEKDEDGNTLLHLAARDPNREIAGLLLAHHADVNARNNRRVTPLSYAAARGHTDLTALLLANGADVNAQDNGGDTALHAAALHGHKGVAELLIAHGANVNARNSRGRTPVDEAIRREHKEIVQLLTAKAQGAGANVQSGPVKKS
jgi:ankyrin repeat protein